MTPLSGSDHWRTPPWLIERIADAFDGIDLDPCAAPSRKSQFARQNYTGGDRDCGLTRSWEMSSAVFVNPPYSRAHLRAWLEKLWRESSWTTQQYSPTEIVALVPASVGAMWWRDYAITADDCIHLHGRVAFLDPANGKSRGAGRFWSSLLYWGRRDLRPLEDLGCRVRVV